MIGYSMYEGFYTAAAARAAARAAAARAAAASDRETSGFITAYISTNDSNYKIYKLPLKINWVKKIGTMTQDQRNQNWGKPLQKVTGFNHHNFIKVKYNTDTNEIKSFDSAVTADQSEAAATPAEGAEVAATDPEPTSAAAAAAKEEEELTALKGEQDNAKLEFDAAKKKLLAAKTKLKKPEIGKADVTLEDSTLTDAEKAAAKAVKQKEQEEYIALTEQISNLSDDVEFKAKTKVRLSTKGVVLAQATIDRLVNEQAGAQEVLNSIKAKLVVAEKAKEDAELLHEEHTAEAQAAFNESIKNSVVAATAAATTTSSSEKGENKNNKIPIIVGATIVGLIFIGGLVWYFKKREKEGKRNEKKNNTAYNLLRII
jgi:hypothetical protein